MNKIRALILVAALFLGGCGTLTFPDLIPKDPIKKDYSKTVEKGCVPLYAKKPDGTEEYRGQACKERYVLNKNWGGEKVGFFGKLFGALGNLTIWTIIAFALFFILSPTAALAWLRSRQYKRALTQTVAGLKQANVMDNDTITNALEDKQDQQTKDLVDIIRNRV